MSRYATPAAFRAALEERVRRWSSERGQDPQRIRQLVIFERLLARLSAGFGADLVLKGGVLLEFRLGRARTTLDLDLRLKGARHRILERLQEAAAEDPGDFLVFQIAPDRRHPDLAIPGTAYEGLRFQVRALLDGRLFGNPFGLDAALAEPLVQEPEPLTAPDLLGFAGLAPASVRAYPWEMHVAEKLHAYTLPRPRENSRVKDLPDLALLASLRTVEAAQLRRVLELVFRNRGTHELPPQVPDPPASWAAVYERLARVDRLTWPAMPALLEAVRGFLDPVLGGGGGEWSPTEWNWHRAGGAASVSAGPEEGPAA